MCVYVFTSVSQLMTKAGARARAYNDSDRKRDILVYYMYYTIVTVVIIRRNTGLTSIRLIASRVRYILSLVRSCDIYVDNDSDRSYIILTFANNLLYIAL